jgi:hypothetical protein
VDWKFPFPSCLLFSFCNRRLHRRAQAWQALSNLGKCQGRSNVNNSSEKSREEKESLPKPTSVAMKTPPRLSSVMPSESSSFKHDAFNDEFQYFAVKSSKKCSFCNSSMTRESSS